MNELVGELLSTYRNAYLAAALVAVGCAVVGLHVVLRRVAFVGITTAQVAAAGAAAAFVLHAPPLVGAIGATAAGLALFAVLSPSERVSRDGLVGVAFVVASSLAVLFVSRSAAELAQVEHVVYGALLFTTHAQVVALAVGVTLVLALHAWFAREFLMVSFDRESARTLGVATGRVELLYSLSLGTMIALSIGTAGSLLTFAFLVVPALCGLQLARRWGGVVTVAIASALAIASLGLLASVAYDTPTGPMIALTSGVAFACAAVGRRSRRLGVGVVLAVLAAATLGVPGGDHDEVRVAADDVVCVEVRLGTASDDRDGTLPVTYSVDVHAGAPARLHLLIEVCGVHVVEPLPSGTGSFEGRVELATDGIVAGHHAAVASVWTGNPFEPDVETELMPPERVSVTTVQVEVSR